MVCPTYSTSHFCSGFSKGTAEQKNVNGFLLWKKFEEYNYAQWILEESAA